MSIQDLGSIGELIAAIATVATLVYLATQIRQNTRMLQANSVAAHTSSSNANATILAQDPGLCELYFGGLAGTYTFAPGQRRQFEMLVGVLMNDLQQSCDLEEQGVASSDLVAKLEGQIAWLVSQPGFQDYWREWSSTHTPTVRDRLARALATQEAAAHKAAVADSA